MTYAGYGDVHGTNGVEYACSICIMIMGAALWALVLGEAGSVAMSMDVEGGNHRFVMDQLNQFFRHRQIPKDLQVGLPFFLLCSLLSSLPSLFLSLFAFLPSVLT